MPSLSPFASPSPKSFNSNHFPCPHTLPAFIATSGIRLASKPAPWVRHYFTLILYYSIPHHHGTSAVVMVRLPSCPGLSQPGATWLNLAVVCLPALASPLISARCMLLLECCVLIADPDWCLLAMRTSWPQMGVIPRPDASCAPV